MLGDDHNECGSTVFCWTENETFFRSGVEALAGEVPLLAGVEWAFIHLCGHNLKDLMSVLPGLLCGHSNRKTVIISSPRLMPRAAYVGLNTLAICAVIRSDVPLSDVRDTLVRVARGETPEISSRLCAGFTGTDFRNLCIHFGPPRFMCYASAGAVSRSGFYRYRKRLTTIFGVKKLERLIFTY